MTLLCLTMYLMPLLGRSRHKNTPTWLHELLPPLTCLAYMYIIFAPLAKISPWIWFSHHTETALSFLIKISMLVACAYETCYFCDKCLSIVYFVKNLLLYCSFIIVFYDKIICASSVIFTVQMYLQEFCWQAFSTVPVISLDNSSSSSFFF